MWIEDEDYRPEYDAAVRGWARRSPKVARIVRRLDVERIRLIDRIFRNLGFRGAEARIRVRITYYHQLGYCALAVRESRRTRWRLRNATLRRRKPNPDRRGLVAVAACGRAVRCPAASRMATD